MIDTTKIILFIVSIVSFAAIIYYVIKSFNQTCPETTHFDKALNQCVQDCVEPQINDIDGSCICPNKTDQFIGGECVPTCPKEKPDLCGSTCYSKLQKSCSTKNELCNIEQTCGDECCGNINGRTTVCSNGDIIFKSPETFFVIEANNVNNKIIIPFGNYSTTDDTKDNYYPKVLSDLLTASSKTTNSYKYDVKLDENKLVFNVSNNGGVQPSFKFDYGVTNEPSKLGFDFSTQSFSSDTLTSANPLITFYCYDSECPSGQEACGDYGCCNNDSCLISTNGLKYCCPTSQGNKICGVGDNRSCCSVEQECCGEICCAIGEKCINGKCQITCTYPDKNGNKLFCDPVPKDGKKSGQYCVDIDSKNQSYCGHSDCKFNSYTYTPVELYGKNGPIIGIPPLKVCSSSDGKLYSNFYDKNGSGLSKKISTSINKDTSEFCTTNDCEQLYNKFDFVKNINVGENTCDVDFECKQILDYNDKFKKDDKDKCPFGPESRQCCYDTSGNFTGQICPDGTISYFNGRDFECIKGWKLSDISGGHGKECTIVGANDMLSELQFPNKCPKGNTGTNCCYTQCSYGFEGESCNTISKLTSLFKTNPATYINTMISYYSYLWILAGPGVDLQIDDTTTFTQGQLYDFKTYADGLMEPWKTTLTDKYNRFVQEWKSKYSVNGRGGQVYLVTGTGAQTINLYFNSNTNINKIKNIYTNGTLDYHVYYTSWGGSPSFDYDRAGDGYTRGPNFATFNWDEGNQSASAIILGM